jgi:HSP20 family protein
MTMVKLNQRPMDRRINNIFEDFFNNFPSRIVNDEFSGINSSVPVNIKENEHAYLLEVIAPGMEKADFKVNIDHNILTVSAEKKTDTKQENERQVRREFNYKSFTRSFTVDDSIAGDKIFAKYENGVLFIELPKKEEVKISPKEIAIQ